MQIFVYESCKYTSPQSVLDNMETRRRSCGCWNFSLHCINMPSVHFCMLGRQSGSHWGLLEWWDSVTHPRSTDDIQEPLLIPWAQIPNTWEICRCGLRCTYQWKSNAWDEDHNWKRNKKNWDEVSLKWSLSAIHYDVTLRSIFFLVFMKY